MLPIQNPVVRSHRPATCDVGETGGDDVASGMSCGPETLSVRNSSNVPGWKGASPPYGMSGMASHAVSQRPRSIPGTGGAQSVNGPTSRRWNVGASTSTSSAVSIDAIGSTPTT
jgi:hypothetical protein